LLVLWIIPSVLLVESQFKQNGVAKRKVKVALEGFQTFFTTKQGKCQCLSSQGKSFITSFPSNGAKKMLFLSLYFKALKYIVKASEKTEVANDKKIYDKKMRAIVGSSTVSVEIPSFPGY
jgi:hypothetical protein